MIPRLARTPLALAAAGLTAAGCAVEAPLPPPREPVPVAMDSPLDISPDDQRMLYAHWYDSPGQDAGIYEMSLADGSSRLVMSLADAFANDHEGYARDYTRYSANDVRYTANGDDVLYSRSYRLLRRSLSTGIESPLAAGRLVYPHVDADPTGQYIVCAAEASISAAVHILDVSSGTMEMLWRPDGQPAYGSRPRWSPDGQWIAYRAYNSDFTAIKIHRIRPDGSELEQVSPDPGRSDGTPLWSADGTEILFSSWATDNLEDLRTHVIDATGANLRDWPVPLWPDRRVSAFSGDRSSFVYAAPLEDEPVSGIIWLGLFQRHTDDAAGASVVQLTDYDVHSLAFPSEPTQYGAGRW